MTTATFSANISPIAKAMTAAYEASQKGTSKGVMNCPKCGSRLNFTFNPDGSSTGRCVAQGCLRWVIQRWMNDHPV